MKLTKRILVAILAVAVIVSCFAFISSAEFTEDNIEDILEYYQYPQYIKEDFDGLTVGDYYELSGSGSGYAAAFLKTNTAKIAVDPADEANKVLSYTNSVNGGKYFGYAVVIDDDTTDNEMISELVSKVSVRVDKGGANVLPSFSLNVYAYDEFGDPVGEAGLVNLLKLDFETGNVSYAKVNPSNASVFAIAPLSDYTVETGEWYDIALFADCNKGTYRFEITSGGSTYESQVFSLGEAELVNEINGSYTSLPSQAGARNYIDNIDIYRGTFLREDASLNVITTQALYDISEFVKNNDITLATQLKIANVYKVITDPASGYVPEYTPDFSAAEAKALYEAAKAFIPNTYTRAFCEASDAINTTRSYSRRMKQVALAESYLPMMNDEAYFNGVAAAALDALSADIAGELDALIAASSTGADALTQLKADCAALITAYKAGEKTDLVGEFTTLLTDYSDILSLVEDANTVISEAEASADKVAAAAAALKAEKSLLARIAAESELFISYMGSYDPAVRDFELIKDIYNKVSTECTYRDNSYNYFSTPNVYDYIDDYAALVAKHDAIVANVTTFQNAVNKMYKEDAVFIDIYNNYLVAKSVYNNGTIHPDVDISTVSMLEIDIDRYLEKEAELYVVIDICDKFISAVNNANEATFYESTKSSLAEAKSILSDNSANIIDDYPGVKEAKASIATIEQRILNLEKAAADYIAAVNAIAADTDRSLLNFTSAVEAARELAKAGNVVGIEGVSEANSLLSGFEAELDSYNGNSKTLIDAVNKAKAEGATLAERRAAIIVANKAVTKAHDDYNGVKAAKTQLAELNEAYIAEVSALNDAFASAVSGAAASASSAINQPKYASIVELVKLLMN